VINQDESGSLGSILAENQSLKNQIRQLQGLKAFWLLIPLLCDIILIRPAIVQPCKRRTPVANRLLLLPAEHWGVPICLQRSTLIEVSDSTVLSALCGWFDDLV